MATSAPAEFPTHGGRAGYLGHLLCPTQPAPTMPSPRPDFCHVFARRRTMHVMMSICREGCTGSERSPRRCTQGAPWGGSEPVAGALQTAPGTAPHGRQKHRIHARAGGWHEKAATAPEPKWPQARRLTPTQAVERVISNPLGYSPQALTKPSPNTGMYFVQSVLHATALTRVTVPNCQVGCPGSERSPRRCTQGAPWGGSEPGAGAFKRRRAQPI